MQNSVNNSFYFNSTAGWRDTIKTLMTPTTKIPNNLAAPKSVYHLSKEKTVKIIFASFVLFAIALLIAAFAITALFFPPLALLVPFLTVGALLGTATGAALVGATALFIGRHTTHRLHIAKDFETPFDEKGSRGDDDYSSREGGYDDSYDSVSFSDEE